MKSIQHIIRLAGLILVGGVVLLAVRAALVPPTFGQYGPYVGASVEVIRSKPLQYVGEEVCKSCHKNEWKKWSRKEHQTVSCEVCHGPSARHSVEDADPRPLPLRCKSNGRMAEQGHDLCMSCHAKVPGRSRGEVPGRSQVEPPDQLKDFPQITAVQHLAEFKITEQSEDYEVSMQCITCHPGHDPLK